ncbi:hypothetical protein JG688_00014586 [Phytophthora aleatoria]|uniref:Transmembrane protein n=1 Tax=Phytophthora aleatoria TaxID=2496075 RepID=A0A8J5M371_9STRA|nr:hypothetical protein JG688_00014586 [Phytophthora aleatoria]
MKVYAAPGSTAGVGRHHKVAKRAHSAARNRAGAGKVEEQDAVVQNAAVAKLELSPERQPFEVFMVSKYVAINYWWLVVLGILDVVLLKGILVARCRREFR